MIAIFLSIALSFRIYRTAEDAGLSARFWVLAGLSIYFAIYLAARFIAESVVFYGVMNRGWEVSAFGDYWFVIEIISLAPALISTQMLLNRLGDSAGVQSAETEEAKQLPNLER